MCLYWMEKQKTNWFCAGFIALGLGLTSNVMDTETEKKKRKRERWCKKVEREKRIEEKNKENQETPETNT